MYPDQSSYFCPLQLFLKWQKLFHERYHAWIYLKMKVKIDQINIWRTKHRTSTTHKQLIQLWVLSNSVFTCQFNQSSKAFWSSFYWCPIHRKVVPESTKSKVSKYFKNRYHMSSLWLSEIHPWIMHCFGKCMMYLLNYQKMQMINP